MVVFYLLSDVFHSLTFPLESLHVFSPDLSLTISQMFSLTADSDMPEESKVMRNKITLYLLQLQYFNNHGISGGI